MPGLMQLRTEYKDEKPLSGARRQDVCRQYKTAVLIETLIDPSRHKVELMAIYSTQYKEILSLTKKFVFAHVVSQEEYRWCIEKQFLDLVIGASIDSVDGGDLTKLMHEKYPELLKEVKGLSEETITGVLRLIEMEKQWNFLVPANTNVNDSVTKSKFDNKYGCRRKSS